MDPSRASEAKEEFRHAIYALLGTVLCPDGPTSARELCGQGDYEVSILVCSYDKKGTPYVRIDTMGHLYGLAKEPTILITEGPAPGEDVKAWVRKTTGMMVRSTYAVDDEW